MTAFERKKLEFDFFGFVKKNFVKPRQCKNIEQIQFYIKELTEKITVHDKTLSAGLR